jgi:hypothetical protein
VTFSEIKGKPTTKLSEDLLTSDIFGCCSFLEYEDLLKDVLGEAIHFNSESQFSPPDSVCSDDYIFWPRFQTYESKQTEPDVLIVLRHSDKECSLVLIESKYNSGKSSEADYDMDEITDQLARELSILEDEKIHRQNPTLSNTIIKSKALIYVTADDTMPKDSMNQSADEFVKKTNYYESKKGIPIYWLPWWKIENLILNTKLINSCAGNKNRVIKHIWDVLSVKKLKRFNGLSVFLFDSLTLSYISEFKDRVRDYQYCVDYFRIPYTYQIQKPENIYRFDLKPVQINYSYQEEN